MKRALLSLSAVLALSALALAAQAQNYIQVVNNTFSGGDPVFQITNDVTFTNLFATQTFADGTTSQITLFDATHTAQTTLDTGTIFLESDHTLNDNGAHGAIQTLTLTGTFDQTNLDLASTLNGSTTNVNVLPTFTTLIGSHVATIYATDAVTGAQYAAGAFSYLGPDGSPVPEPTTGVALGAISTLTAGAMFLYRRAKRA